MPFTAFGGRVVTGGLFGDAEPAELDSVPVDAGGAGLLFDAEVFTRRRAPAVRYFERSWLFDDAGTVLAVAEVSKQARRQER